MATPKDIEGRLIVSTSPHLRGTESIPDIMWVVSLSLLPALGVATYVFGYMALAVIVTAVLAAMVTEALVQRMLGRQVTISDGSAFLTGLLLAFTLPPIVGWYVPVVGAVVAIGIAKHCFGGLGNNIFNPALLGRAFVHFAFPVQMNLADKWPQLPKREILQVFSGNVARMEGGVGEIVAITRATPLGILKDNPGTAFENLPGGYGLMDLFTGTTPGCIGETSALALLIGGVALILMRHVNWRLPVAYIGTVAVLVFLLPVPVAAEDGATKLVGGLPAILAGEYHLARLAAHMMAGGLMLGAFFMATDMVTSPITGKGQVVFGIGAGILVALIRLYGGYPEGVCYSILLMNTATPLIDRCMRPRLFGKRKKKEGTK